MSKAIFALLLTVVVAAAVWYAVTRFPRVEQATQQTDNAVTARRDTARGETDTLRLPTGDSVLLGSLPRVTGAACGTRCGIRRWAVKSLSDPDREKLRLKVVPATVEELIALERPQLLPEEGRAAPVETTVFRVRARLLEVRPENDGDVHLILGGLRDSSAIMIAELPDPSCAGACSSGFGPWYAAARDEVARWERSQVQTAPVVVVTGVGFFDVEHGQDGAAPNGIELHPVLRLTLVP